MFRAVTAILISFTVFMHAVTGCCAHHLHASTVDSTQAAAVSHESATHGCCSLDTQRREHKHIATLLAPGCSHDCGACDCPGNGPSQCSEVDCVFVAPNGPTTLEFDDGVSLPCAATVTLTSGLLTSVQVRWEKHLAQAESTDRALRRHLALGVLLL